MKFASVLFFSLLICFVSNAQSKEVKYGQLGSLPREDAAMQQFRSNRFGQFIHWGLYAIPAGVWNGKVYPGASEFLKGAAKVTTDEWAALSNQFNPEKYNPKEWACLAKKMGVKYATFTTKHHDGFCLWPSKFTNFDMDITSGKRDLVGEFVKAYNDEGIDVYLYYSVLDWHHPDWRYKLVNEQDSIAFNRFKGFVRNQLIELLELYPTTKGFWFDGTWDESWKKRGQFSYELEKELKTLSPDLIVNSRFRADEHGARHFDSNGVLMGDYESGYERRLPSPYDMEVPTRDWEAVMTIAENLWGYHSHWEGHIKSDTELIEMLVRCVALNGNFLLNFGPKADGSIRTEEQMLIKQIGGWMDSYSSAIYDCGYAGLERQDWGYYTAKKNSNQVNMIIFNVPVSKRLRVKLPKDMKLTRASFTTVNKNIRIDASVNGEFFLHIPDANYKEPFVIVIDIEPVSGSTNHYMAPLI